MFVSVETAARIEKAECRLLYEAGQAALENDPDGDVYLQDIAGGIAAYIRAGAPMNKLAGLGFARQDELVSEEELAAALEPIEKAFASRGAPLQAEVSSLADPAVARLLTRRGYVIENCENVLGCELPSTSLPEMPADIDLSFEEGPPSSQWLDVVIDGFAAPDDQGVASHEEFPREVLELAIRDLAGVDGFRTYEARLDGNLAGAGSMRLAGGLAQLTGAATLPTHRRRGVQTALLRRRLEDAAAAGCELALVTTQPGSKSQQNVQRFGFRLLYTRIILVLEPPA